MQTFNFSFTGSWLCLLFIIQWPRASSCQPQSCTQWYAITKRHLKVRAKKKERQILGASVNLVRPSLQTHLTNFLLVKFTCLASVATKRQIKAAEERNLLHFCHSHSATVAQMSRQILHLKRERLTCSEKKPPVHPQSAFKSTFGFSADWGASTEHESVKKINKKAAISLAQHDAEMKPSVREHITHTVTSMCVGQGLAALQPTLHFHYLPLALILHPESVPEI